MLLKASSITGCAIQASDGEIGSVSDLLFEDESWSVRWIVADTGSWLSGRKVLLPSLALREATAGMTAIPVDLTRDQVEGSPDIDTDQPVSRQMETSAYGYYGFAPQWPVGARAAMPPWGYAGAALAAPIPGAYAPVGGQPGTTALRARPSGDPHLRSIKHVTGYTVRGTDEEVGNIADFLIDAQGWAIRYLIVDTGSWWSGKQVLVAPNWIDAIEWGDQAVRVEKTREEVKAAPEYDPDRPVDREYRHYGAPAYWGGAP